MNFTCNYCKKDFLKETTLAVHVCEPKRRFQEQNERGVQLGFQAYIKFYEVTQGSAKLKTFEHFAESSFYRAFVKFGRYCVSIRAINPARFTEWLIRQNKKIDYWCKDSIYTEYLLDYLKLENVNDALARAIEFSMDWAEKSGHPAQDCLRYGNSNAMAYAVTTGRISPWVLYNSESGLKFLSELDATQVAMVWPYIDSEAWSKKFADYMADQEYARDILKKAGW
jgi:hypothetical protein